jgi:hypothetical protein
MNPFGFAIGVPQGVTNRKPAQVMRRGPQDIPAAPFGFTPPPSKMQQTADILAPYVTGPWNAITGIMDTPLHVLLGGGTQEEQDQAVANSFNSAAVVGGTSSVASRPANSLGVFGGMYSKTADHAARKEAQRLEAEGADANTIRAATGWFKGADQKWRYEIPDTHFVVLDDAAVDVGGKVTHNRLFEAYPQLRDLVYNEADLGGAYGQYWKGVDAETGENLKGISTDAKINSDQRRSTMIHELQHAVQDIEGFEPGSNPVYSKTDAQAMADAITQTPEAIAAREADYQYDGKRQQAMPLWRSTSIDRFDRMIERPSLKPRDVFRMGDWYSVSDKYRGEAGPMPKKPGPKRDEWLRGAAQAMKNDYLESMSAMDRYDVEQVQRMFPTPNDRKNAVARLERQLGKFASGSRDWMRINDKINELRGLDSFDAYKRSVGETEARNVQKRLNMTKEELANVAPWDTQDIPFGMQIPRVLNSNVVRSILNSRGK